MRSYITLLFCSIQFLIHAQDTIYKRSGEVLASKVIEINTKTVSYKRFDMLDGPLFILNKSDVKKIKYVTGAVDSFNVVKEEPMTVTGPLKTNMGSYQSQEKIQLARRRGSYTYQGHSISEKNVLFMATDKNRTWKSKDLALAVYTTNRNKKLQYMTGFGGAALGGVMMVGSIIGSSASNSGAVGALVFVNGIGILITSQIISASFKKKRARSTAKVVELYNQNF